MPKIVTLKKPAVRRKKAKENLPSLEKLNSLKKSIEEVKSSEPNFDTDLFEVSEDFVETESNVEDNTIEKGQNTLSELPPTPAIDNPRTLSKAQLNKMIKEALLEERKMEEAAKEEKRKKKEQARKEAEIKQEQARKEAEAKQKAEEMMTKNLLARKEVEIKRELENYLNKQIGTLTNKYKQELTKNLQFTY